MQNILLNCVVVISTEIVICCLCQCNCFYRMRNGMWVANVCIDDKQMDRRNADITQKNGKKVKEQSIWMDDNGRLEFRFFSFKPDIKTLRETIVGIQNVLMSCQLGFRAGISHFHVEKLCFRSFAAILCPTLEQITLYRIAECRRHLGMHCSALFDHRDTDWTTVFVFVNYLYMWHALHRCNIMWQHSLCLIPFKWFSPPPSPTVHVPLFRRLSVLPSHMTFSRQSTPTYTVSCWSKSVRLHQ